MSFITDISEFRGIMQISAEGCSPLRIRKVHFAKRPLEVGDDIDLEEYESVMASIQFPDAYEAALTSLDFCARTAQEIQRSLRMKGYVAPAAEAVVARLIENRLLDDRQLAARIAESNASKPIGIYAVKRKLQAKGISEEDASDALEALDDEQQQAAALQAGKKLLRRYSSLPTRETRAKLSQALARRGFGWEAVRSAVDSLLCDDEDYEY